MEERIARIAADRESGASEILAEAIAILRDALDARADVVAAARSLCRAQPTMAPMWNAATAALAAREQPDRFARFAEQVTRAPAAVARFAIQIFRDGPDDAAPLRVTTLSASATVLHVIEALARVRAVHVSCAESRPALEGRRLAERLAGRSIPVSCFTDAAIAHGVDGADAVLVGADAVTPAAVVNKSGTRMLAATAGLLGVPVYVLASREKFVHASIAARLGWREGSPAEVWETPPAGVAVRNPCFERLPLDLVTAVVTDFGTIGAGSVAEVCEAQPPVGPELTENY